MKKYQPAIEYYGIAAQAAMRESKHGQYYHKDEVNERIAELEKALREAMEWNWLDEHSPPLQEVVDQCNNALMVR